MRYTAEISRRNPTCWIFLVDQSGSMADRFAGAPAGTSKAQGVADAINSLLLNFVLASTTGTGIANRFHIGVIGYGSFVGPILGGSLADRMLVPVGELGHHPLRVLETKENVRKPSGGTVEKTVRKPRSQRSLESASRRGAGKRSRAVIRASSTSARGSSFNRCRSRHRRNLATTLR